MKKIFLMLFIVVITACTHNNPNNMIDFTYAGNIPIIGDTINNEIVHFIIDTGAGMSIINSDYYQANKRNLIYLDDVELQLFGINGIAPYKTSATVGLYTSIGYCRFQESDLSSVVKKINALGYNVIGIIGSDFWRNDYIINYKTKQVLKYE
jgi:hypothetical protein